METKISSDKSDFHVFIGGFNRTIAFSCSGGSASRKFVFEAPDFGCEKVGYHSAEIDSQASDPRYHPPGTALVEDE